MKQPRPISGQRGAVLVVALIMLVVITMLVAGAFSMSSVSLRAAGNMQARDEAIAAGNQAIEQVVNTNFTANPVPQGFNIDINNDGTADYQVNFAAPACISGEQLFQVVPPLSSRRLRLQAPAPFFRTIWELVGTVTDLSGGGVSMRVHQGVSVVVNRNIFALRCSATAPLPPLS